MMLHSRPPFAISHLTRFTVLTRPPLLTNFTLRSRPPPPPPLSRNVIFSTHCHNDLGLATANTLAGIEGGARQAEGTVNGIGERAGNTSLEELVMCIATRPKLMSVQTSINTQHITRASRMVSALTGMVVQPNKAIVGANAFAHEAGIHQDGVLKHPDTYEIMLPESVGLTQSNLVLGKHSGKHAYQKRLEELGYTEITDEEMGVLTAKFKVLADEKKVVTDADMEAIVNDEIYQAEDKWNLDAVHFSGGDMIKPTATITLVNSSGDEWTQAAVGTGPVDAMFKAIDNIVGVDNQLIDYRVGAITGGTVALGEVTVRISAPTNEEGESPTGTLNLVNPQTGLVTDRQFTGMAANSDILVASARAYVHALNRMIVGGEQYQKRLERRRSRD